MSRSALFTAMREGRPHVTLKAGMTADGKIADVHGVARWITGEAARAEAHQQRSEVDAIVATCRAFKRAFRRVNTATPLPILMR